MPKLTRWRDQQSCRTWALAGASALLGAMLLSAMAPWASLVLFLGGGAALLGAATHRLTRDAAAVYLVLAAFGTRVLLAAAVYLIAAYDLPFLAALRTAEGYWQFALDVSLYDRYLQQVLAGSWAELSWTSPGVWFVLPAALVARLVGYTPLLAPVLNGIYAAVACLLAFAIVRGWSERPQARLACALFAFWPSWILWSSVFLKETLILLLLTLSIGCAIVLDRSLAALHWRALGRVVATCAALGGTLAALYVVRQAVVLSWLVALPVALLLSAIGALRLARHREAVLRAALPALVVLAVVLVPDRLPQVVPYCRLCGLAAGDPVGLLVGVLVEQRGYSIAYGGVFAPGVDRPMSTPAEVLALAPLAFGNALLAPYPVTWFQAGQTVGMFRVLATVETMALYLVLFPLLFGTWRTLGRGAAAAPFVLLLALVLATTTGLVVVNEGGLFRYRDAPMALLVLVGTAGLDLPAARAWLQSRLRPSPERKPPLLGPSRAGE